MLSRADALYYLQAQGNPHPAIKVAIKALKEPEIIRCKDCKFWNDDDITDTGYHPCTHTQTSPNWYCADGKRKET